jgi:hypothetical protein
MSIDIAAMSSLLRPQFVWQGGHENVYIVHSKLAETSGPLEISLSNAVRQYGHPAERQEHLLRVALCKVFEGVMIGSKVHVDPEEGWTRRMLVVHTNIADLDGRMALEDRFYAFVADHQSLTDALREITVVFE